MDIKVRPRSTLIVAQMQIPAFPYPASELVIDPALIRKYDVSGPRYTSYPTADRFVEAFGDQSLQEWLLKRNIGGINRPLSLYFHLPFCNTLCYYCACNKVITRDRSRSAQYIKCLKKEMALIAPLLGSDRQVCQLHWGGGTPTFLSPGEMRELIGAIESHFTREQGAEYAVEVDPRQTGAGTMELLAGLGFDRVSFGVQDFDPEVQEAVHRIQSEAQTRAVVEQARASGFRSVNVDLIYGLPKQTLDGFNRTLDKVLELGPDRIALYSYAHLPKTFLPQRRIAEAGLPAPGSKLDIMTLAIGRLACEGYVYIGMDHFARSGDELAIAQTQGRLQRNFQGYSTHPESDILAFGVSAIGRVGPTYYQNEKELPAYCAALDAGRLPVARGIVLTQDDLARRAVIQALACHFCVSIESIELSYLVDFSKGFAAELADLRAMESQGLVQLTPDWITVTPKGRLLVRVICMVFDGYLRKRRERATYSKVI